MHNKCTFVALLTANLIKTKKLIARNAMEKKSMYYNIDQTKICRDHYKPSIGVMKLIKSVWAVIMIGESPISQPRIRRRMH